MRAVVRRLGNSSGLIIPKAMLDEAGMAVGDAVDMTLEKGRIVLAPVRRRVRSGWAAASRTLAEAGDDGLARPEFGNADDEALEW